MPFDPETFRVAGKDLLDHLFKSLFDPTLSWSPLPAARQQRAKHASATAAFDAVTRPEIEKLLAEMVDPAMSVKSGRLPGSLFEVLIRTDSRFVQGSTEALVAEARVFINAGFETTAHSLAFTLGLLAENKLEQDRCAAEARRTCGKGKRRPTRQAVREGGLEVNYGAFMESCRLFPLAPVITGLSTGAIDVTTEDGRAYRIPANSSVLAFNGVVQRCNIPQPDDFVPDRWSSSSRDKPYLATFNRGAHACPGKPLSVLEAQVILPMVLDRFVFDFPEGVEKMESVEDLLVRPMNKGALVVRRRG